MRRVIGVILLLLALPGTASAGAIFLVSGHGWGHGIGMSQWGAEGAARHGWSYQRILALYYPHTRIEVVRPRPVRVLLRNGVERVRIGSHAPFLVVDGRGRRLRLPPRTYALDRLLLLRGRRLAPPLWFVAGAQPLSLGGAPYRGDLLVESRDAALLVVNVLPLDRYLRAVVPREMPRRWDAQAYEAQAVVARSYALATLKPGGDYDLLPDSRSQVYGGIRAERKATNLAVGATAGRVLTYGGRVIPAYYHSSSGGRTASIADEWGGAAVPYLVSVRDPFDRISPYHSWGPFPLTAAGIGARFDVAGVRDVRVVRNGSGRAARVRVIGARTRLIPAKEFAAALGLRSDYFSIEVLALEEPTRAGVFGRPLTLSGFLRGLPRARLQERTAAGAWQVVRRIQPHSDGRFEAIVRPAFSTSFRLAFNGTAGTEVEVSVVPRVVLRADGEAVAGRILPAGGVVIERLSDSQWRPVAWPPVSENGSFRADLRPGSYRARTPGTGRFLAAVTPPVGVR